MADDPDFYYLFTSFRKNGEDGVYLALSRDGLHWQSLTEDTPFIPVDALHTKQVRDPCVARGPDGAYHMVWTSGGAPTFGYARSADLITWTDQREIALLTHEPAARNAWAPELFFDSDTDEWLILWSTTVAGMFPDIPCLPGWEGFNHRIYATRTRDFTTFSPGRLFFDPGYTVIDAAVVRGPDKYYLVFKDERYDPLHMALRCAASDRVDGPYTAISDLLTPAYTEAPSALQIGEYYYVYFDHYWQPQHYGALRTRDFTTWENVTDQMTFPADHRHGSVVTITAEIAARLGAAAAHA